MGRIMDAIHYDKIADKLIQFHSKLPMSDDLQDIHAQDWVLEMKDLIEKMLTAVDNLAIRDEKGFLR
jgi:hypothetical protein